jgi:glutathione peroxidase
MKTLLFTLSIMLANVTSVYDFKIKSIDGELIDFKRYQGKTLLIVNVASKCGYTPQYADLEKLHENYGDKVVVLGFPANNFGAQEPGSNAEIAEFCKKNYGVKFQMFEKISVKGADQHPLYQWLKEKTGQEPSWNFCKYLVKPDGTVKFFPSKVKPLDAEILNEII